MSTPLRQEGVALRPYKAVDALEIYLEHNSRLSVHANGYDLDLQSGRILGLPKDEMEAMGLTFIVDDIYALRDSIEPLVMSLEDVDVLFVAKDRPSSPIRESVLVSRFSLNELQSVTVLNAAGAISNFGPLQNRSSGFVVEVAFVLNKSVAGTTAIHPRELGALLVKTFYEVRPVSENDSFQPEPLTDDIRDLFSLPKRSWMYIEFKPALLSATEFRDAARFYVHQDVLADIQFLDGDAGILAQNLLQTQFVTALIYQVSRTLLSDDAPEQDDIVQSQVFLLFHKRFSNKSSSELIQWLRDEPANVLVAWQSKPELANPLVKAVNNLVGGIDDVSSSETE
jgi:hypothetical protein